MGIPGLSRWLQRKYSDITKQCIDENEDDSRSINVIQPNPNGIEFDNLYLDMNDIIHSSSKQVSKSEDEIIKMIFQYIDRIFSLVRPRKLLYMAIDGVAPRAKLNQQRSRCFLDAQNNSFNIDSFNKCHIKPGTAFMSKLSDHLQYYIYYRMNTDLAWRSIKVILSDGNVPGEGEHKIFDFIRTQTDVNVNSVVFGTDSDLILLGLTLHTSSFKILREDFESNDSQRKKYIFIDLKALRVNLKSELITDLPEPLQWDSERAIDDWILMCFLGGNDFLPNIPSIQFYENVMDTLTDIYKHDVLKVHGYLTENKGQLNRDHLKILLKCFSDNENNIFQNRQRRNVSNNIQTPIKSAKPPIDMNKIKQSNAVPFTMTFAPPWMKKNSTSVTAKSPKMKLDESSPENRDSSLTGGDASNSSMPDRQEQADSKDENAEPNDIVRLGEEGWHERYYQQKFNIDVNALENFRAHIVQEFVQGLCWMLEYYYKRVPSWDWYYPYHYAPFACDFSALNDALVSFNTESKPWKPLEQLMATFPPRYARFLPGDWQKLMTDEESPISHFYPTDFSVDLNGKLKKEQGVALLPFVDETLLLQTLTSVYSTLTPEEQKRNRHDYDHLFIHSTDSCYTQLKDLYNSKNKNQRTQANPLKISRELSDGMTGQIWLDDQKLIDIGATIRSPVSSYGKDIKNNQVLFVKYRHS